MARHGGEAAGLKRLLRGALRTAASAGGAPGVVLAGLNYVLLGAGDDCLATAAYAVVHPASGTVLHSSAGHLPLVCSGPGGARTLDGPVGLPLGVVAGVQYEEGLTAVPSAGTLLAYTDGLVERRGEDIDVGLRRLLEAACTASTGSLPAQIERIFADLTEGSRDDAGLLGLRLPPQPIG